jgi:hypothetical protein
MSLKMRWSENLPSCYEDDAGDGDGDEDGLEDERKRSIMEEKE